MHRSHLSNRYCPINSKNSFPLKLVKSLKMMKETATKNMPEPSAWKQYLTALVGMNKLKQKYQ